MPCEALDNFLTTFNSKDELLWAKTLNYPHVRMLDDQVTVCETSEAYTKDQDLQKLAKAIGWDNTRWDYRYVVQDRGDGKHNEIPCCIILSLDWIKMIIQSPVKHMIHSNIITNNDGHWGRNLDRVWQDHCMVNLLISN